MNDDIRSETRMEEYIENKYIVIFPDKTLQMFKSLRDIQKYINVSASTISKKLKNQSKCICKTKGTDYVYGIIQIS
tara:strand:+ start:50 stop:277 length:228 start_codon:yes stop_codon:yes gene_type:complete